MQETTCDRGSQLVGRGVTILFFRKERGKLGKIDLSIHGLRRKKEGIKGVDSAILLFSSSSFSSPPPDRTFGPFPR